MWPLRLLHKSKAAIESLYRRQLFRNGCSPAVPTTAKVFFRECTRDCFGLSNQLHSETKGLCKLPIFGEEIAFPRRKIRLIIRRLPDRGFKSRPRNFFEW
jgi:hypothetical protein